MTTHQLPYSVSICSYYSTLLAFSSSNVSCFVKKGENAHLEIYKKGALSYVNYHENREWEVATQGGHQESGPGEVRERD